MRDPRAVLKDALGDLDLVEILGVKVRLSREVTLDTSSDMEELLADNIERIALWERRVAACRLAASSADDDYREAKAVHYAAYYEDMELRERAEMKELLHDETEVDRDKADAEAGDATFTIRRRQRAAARVTGGPAACRWRRNFSDDLVNANVNRSPKVILAKKASRDATNQLDIAQSVLRTLEHRSRAISHLCAIHRDNSRL